MSGQYTQDQPSWHEVVKLYEDASGAKYAAGCSGCPYNYCRQCPEEFHWYDELAERKAILEEAQENGTMRYSFEYLQSHGWAAKATPSSEGEGES